MTKMLQAGYYRSPLGGAHKPNIISNGSALFEIITAGEVYGVRGFEDTLYEIGSVFFHREGEYTVYRSQPGSFYHCLTLYYETSEEHPWPTVFLWQDKEKVVQFANEILHSFHYNKVDKNTLGDYAYNHLKFRLEIDRVNQNQSTLPSVLHQGLAYIEKFYGQDIRVDEIANELMLSSSHTHALFVKHLKKTPHQIIIERRLQEACHRLVVSMDPIKVVADEVGYANVENFCRAFKRKHHLTPASYRKKFTIAVF